METIVVFLLRSCRGALGCLLAAWVGVAIFSFSGLIAAWLEVELVWYLGMGLTVVITADLSIQSLRQTFGLDPEEL